MADSHSKYDQLAGGLRCAAVSDVGMRRSSNQDSFAVALAEGSHRWKSHGHLFVVADGMGAHAAGELASQLATENIPHSYHKLSDQSPSEAIVAAVSQVNNLIYSKGQNSVDFQGMGTTCSCLLLLPCGAMVAHVGDSRVYRLRGEVFEQLTFDHSLVWEMAAAGHASEDEIPAYVPKNVITRSLGPHPTVSVDVEGPFDMQPGDRYLLCSDGLTGPLAPSLIGMVLGALPPDDAAQTLADLANLLGGPDNITSIVTEVFNPAELGQPAPENPQESSIGSRSAQGKVSPITWAVMVLFVILAACFGLLGFSIAAGVCGLGFMATGIFAWMQYANAASGGLQEEVGIRGKAPYRQHDCKPSAQSIETLTDIVRQLEDLEDQRDWDIDWELIRQDRGKAHKAIASGDYQAAVVSYCSAVRRLMQALRESRNLRPSDSTIDLG